MSAFLNTLAISCDDSYTNAYNITFATCIINSISLFTEILRVFCRHYSSLISHDFNLAIFRPNEIRYIN
jgi:hypothetical protein